MLDSKSQPVLHENDVCLVVHVGVKGRACPLHRHEAMLQSHGFDDLAARCLAVVPDVLVQLHPRFLLRNLV